MIIEIPFLPVSVNNAYATNWTTRKRFKTKEYNDFIRNVSIFFRDKKMITGEVQVEYNFYWEDRRRRDLSNYIKTMEDVLVSFGIIEDDSKVRKIIVEKGYGIPTTVIEVLPYPNKPDDNRTGENGILEDRRA